MKLFVILESGGDGYTYSYSNVLDSIWSTEELALQRLYFLEDYYKKDEFKSFEYHIEEMPIDTIPNCTLGYYGNDEIEKLWAERKDIK